MARPQTVGVLLALTANIASASFGVYIAAWMQKSEPFLILYLMIWVTALFFVGMTWARRISLWQTFRSHWRWGLALNVSTWVSWICWVYSMRLLEPAIVQAISLAVGPIVLVLFARWLRPGVRILLLELLGAIGSVGGVLLLARSTLLGRSAVGLLSSQEVVFGVIQAVLTGLGVLGNTLCSKRLMENGCGIDSLMSIRFILLLGTGWFWFPAESWQAAASLSYLGQIALAAVFGSIFPIGLTQIAIGKVEPLTLSLLFTLVPVLAYFFEFLDPRLSPSPASIVGIGLCLGGTFLAVFSRIQHPSHFGAKVDT